ncbi:hypothetical protein ACFYTS_33990 [Nocardia sp. NPDC004151]|uniref:hypothetical protein n=1 Tax=Nocardia sp. NPDC004151 TaxID=3364304 RepID=UPI0036AADB1A
MRSPTGQTLFTADDVKHGQKIFLARVSCSRGRYSGTVHGWDRIPGEVALTPGQRSTRWYFAIMVILFGAQSLIGAATEEVATALGKTLRCIAGRLTCPRGTQAGLSAVKSSCITTYFDTSAGFRAVAPPPG